MTILNAKIAGIMKEFKKRCNAVSDIMAYTEHKLQSFLSRGLFVSFLSKVRTFDVIVSKCPILKLTK